MDGEAWGTAVHGVAKSRTQTSNWTELNTKKKKKAQKSPSLCSLARSTKVLIVWLFVTPWTVAHRLLCPWDFPGKNTGVGCHFLLQGIFPTQRSNLCLLRCRQIFYHPSHQGSAEFFLPFAPRLSWHLLTSSTASDERSWPCFVYFCVFSSKL